MTYIVSSGALNSTHSLTHLAIRRNSRAGDVIVESRTNVGARRQKKMLLEEENSWRFGVVKQILAEDLWCVNCN